MATMKRDNVYIWVTWLSKLIAGEDQCEYAAWFKAHYKYDKIPSDFQLSKWSIKHNQLLHKHRDELEDKGYVVRIEDQNGFRMDLPKGVTVSGKVDIVAFRADLINIVVDCKTGKPKNSDQVQVLLYMIFLPQCIKEYKEITFDGSVVYTDSEVPIFWSDVDNDLREVVQELIDRVGADKPCRKTPSSGECKWCDISKKDCPERIE